MSAVNESIIFRILLAALQTTAGTHTPESQAFLADETQSVTQQLYELRLSDFILNNTVHFTTIAEAIRDEFFKRFLNLTNGSAADIEIIWPHNLDIIDYTVGSLSADLTLNYRRLIIGEKEIREDAREAIYYLANNQIKDSPAEEAAPAADLKTAWNYTIWFGTSRKPEQGDAKTVRFTTENSDQLYYGTCDVSIPRSHHFGSTGSSWFKRWMNHSDDRLRIAGIALLEYEKFWSQMRNLLMSCPSDSRQALVYIHGYNTSFEKAAIRAAQIGFDLKVPGVTAFFSWPSRGRMQDYLADEEMIQASEATLMTFLTQLVQESGADTIHIVAHSMGNRGLLRAIQRLHGDESLRGSIKFGQIFLAAPDLNVALFHNLAAAYTALSDRTTLYVSPADRALQLSQHVHGDMWRVGFSPPVTTVAGIDTVLVPGRSLMDLGHGYYAEFDGVLSDMYDLIRHNTAPKDRQRIQGPLGGQEVHWEIVL